MVIFYKLQSEVVIFELLIVRTPAIPFIKLENKNNE